MKDAITARLTDARTIAIRAAVEMAEGEAKARVQVALAALSDALEQRQNDVDRALSRLIDDLEGDAGLCHLAAQRERRQPKGEAA